MAELFKEHEKPAKHTSLPAPTITTISSFDLDKDKIGDE
jgi:hypothetical protein